MIKNSTAGVNTTVVRGTTGILIVEGICSARWIIETLGKPHIPDRIEASFLAHPPSCRTITATGTRCVGSIQTSTCGSSWPWYPARGAHLGRISIPEVDRFAKDVGICLIQLTRLVLVDQICGELGQPMRELVCHHIVGGQSVAEGTLIAIPDGVGTDSIVPVDGGSQGSTITVERITTEAIEEKSIEISGSIVGIIYIEISCGCSAFGSCEIARQSSSRTVINFAEKSAMNRRPVVDEFTGPGIDEDMLCKHLGALENEVKG